MIVTVTLKDSANVSVSGETWPKTLAKVGGDSTGLYRATLAAAVALTSGARYTAAIDATASGAVGRWDADVIAQTRRS